MDIDASAAHHASERRGLLVAFEGIDGAGKSTQAKLLAEWLGSKGFPVSVFHEPTPGPVGLEIRRLAKAGRDELTPRREFELFLEDRAWDVRERIGPALARGEVVLMDRYYISSMAYQGALGLDPAEILRANEAIAPRPDLVLVFTLPVDVALERVCSRHTSGQDLFEKRESLVRVREIFDGLEGSHFRHIDAEAPLDAITERVRAEVEPMLARVMAAG